MVCQQRSHPILMLKEGVLGEIGLPAAAAAADAVAVTGSLFSLVMLFQRIQVEEWLVALYVEANDERLQHADHVS